MAQHIIWAVAFSVLVICVTYYNIYGPKSPEIVCIEMKGEWNRIGWNAPACKFPQNKGE